jgi:VanZ family protein
MTASASGVPPRPRSPAEFALHVLPALLWAVLVFIGGGMNAPQPELDVGLPIDKLQHVVAFLIMQVLAYRALRFVRPQQSRGRRAWLGALAAAGLGVLLELYQLGLPHRSAELADVVADCIGAGIGALLLARS